MRGGGGVEQQGSVVNARHVDRTAGLVLFRVQGKRVHIDTSAWDGSVVLVRLHQVEVTGLTSAESFLTVQLEDSVNQSVSTSVREIRPLVGRFVTLRVEDPDEFLARVVQGQLALDSRVGVAFSTSELKLFNQVFVLNLSELAAFIGVKVDVINVQRTIADGRNSRRDGASAQRVQFIHGADGNVELDFVILQSNQGQGKTRVAAKPELKRDIQSISWGRVSRGVVRQRRDATNHGIITSSLFSSLGQFVPDGQPFTVVLVNGLTTDINGDFINQSMTKVLHPVEATARSSDRWNLHLQVGAVQQITVAGHRARHFATKVKGTIEGLFNSFQSKVRVTTVHNLEERDLRITSEVNILPLLKKSKAQYFYWE